ARHAVSATSATRATAAAPLMGTAQPAYARLQFVLAMHNTGISDGVVRSDPGRPSTPGVRDLVERVDRYRRRRCSCCRTRGPRFQPPFETRQSSPSGTTCWRASVRSFDSTQTGPNPLSYRSLTVVTHSLAADA